MESVVLDENVFNILVATDIHLGYKENDRIRGNDSFITFEEILSLAVKKKVDFLLLGGDIFHSKPSQSCLYKCFSLLHRYCMGDRPTTFKSESSENFRDGPNYKNPNLKISLPVFCIHGNHDLTGRWQQGPIDLLDVSGLVNYFGNHSGKEKIDVQPICFQKGSSRLAIFGLGYIKDEYLSKLFRDRKVNIEPKDDHFNIMVLHQNRVPRGPRETSYIKDEYLSPSLDLVIWGHEHDCIPNLAQSSSKTFPILQPGSSVATSLSKGEATKKHVFLLKVEGRKLKSVEPIRLLTVRPFVYRAKLGINCLNEISIAKVEECISKEIEEMIEEAASLQTGEL